MHHFSQPFPCSLRELSPSAAHLCLRVRDFLTENGIAKGTTLVAAFSGGADSSALAVLLHCLGMRIVLAHLDHGLRCGSGAESDHVRRFAAALGVASVCERTDVADLARATRTGVEEAGRNARYAFLKNVRESSTAAYIATGHHLDDLAEDQLMRLIRGAGWPSLAGMHAFDARRHLVRPLLQIRRDELTAFLEELNIPWLEDPSNQDDTFRRNRVRNHILPLIRKENPSFTRSVADLWRLAREDETYWDELLAGALASAQSPATNQSGAQGALLLPQATAAALPRAARLRLYRKVIGRLNEKGNQISIRAQTLFHLDDAWAARRSGTRFQLPGADILLLSEGILFRSL